MEIFTNGLHFRWKIELNEFTNRNTANLVTTQMTSVSSKENIEMNN